MRRGSDRGSLTGPRHRRPPRRPPPTTEQLLGALDAVETQAREGRVPGVVLSRLTRVTRVVRDSIPRLERLGVGSAQGYSVMATATDYLPVAIGNYLRPGLGRHTPDRCARARSCCSSTSSTCWARRWTRSPTPSTAPTPAIIVHGAFLEEKFGHASTGGSLGLGAPDPTPGPGSSPITGPLSPPE